MNVKKFLAATSREALRKVRDAMGPDAVILSNRAVEGGVEILALPSDDIASLASPTQQEEKTPDLELAQYASLQQASAPRRMAAAIARSEPIVASEPVKKAGDQIELSTLMQEIRAMRGMMEAQLAELSWNSMQQHEPHKAVMLRQMLAAGFSASLSRFLVEKLPAIEKDEAALQWVKSILTHNMSSIPHENEILEKGGVYALVGPTGVGKTTSTAKLAARCVMRHGADQLALITTDGYRIGGHEQLRIYGKILGVMVHSVRDEADLRIALKELRNKRTVLIDTVGVSQRDQMVAEQVAMLSSVDVQVKRLLCLSATSTAETLNEVIQAYQGAGLLGCILTKVDEAATIGSALDAIIRQKLYLYFITDGQRVPEDLHPANHGLLVDNAFKLQREASIFGLQDTELPLVLSGAAAFSERQRSGHEMFEVNLG